MGFFSHLFSFAKKAIPSVLGYAIAGPVGGAIGGALGGAMGGGGVKGALLGGVSGYGLGSAVGSLTGYTGGNALDGLLGTSNGSFDFGSLFGGSGSGSSGGGGILSSLTGGNPLLSMLNAGSSLYSGISGSAAAKSQANALKQASLMGMQAQNNALGRNYATAAPYLAAGGTAAGQLTKLVNDPNAQKAFISNNPFYNSLAEDAKNKLFANAAARGKIGTGGTAAALQNQLLLLGNNLLDQNIGQNQNIANMGTNSANNLNLVNQSGTNNLTSLINGYGEAQAGGIKASNNAITGSINNGLLTQALLSGAIHL